MVRQASEYKEFEDWIADRIGPEAFDDFDLFSQSIESQRGDDEILSNREVMDGIEQSFMDLKQQQLSQGVSERLADRIMQYFDRVIAKNKTAKNQERIQSKLREFQLENVQVSRDTRGTFKLNDLINENIDIREESERLTEKKNLIPKIIEDNTGKKENEIRQALIRAGIDQELWETPTNLRKIRDASIQVRTIKEPAVSPIFGPLASIEKKVAKNQSDKYKSVISRIMDADTVDQLDNIEDSLDELTPVNYLEADKILQRKRLKVDKKISSWKKAQIDRTLGTVPKNITEREHTLRRAKRLWKDFVKESPGIDKDPRKINYRVLVESGEGLPNLRDIEADLLIEDFNKREERSAKKKEAERAPDVDVEQFGFVRKTEGEDES